MYSNNRPPLNWKQWPPVHPRRCTPKPQSVRPRIEDKVLNDPGSPMARCIENLRLNGEANRKYLNSNPQSSNPETRNSERSGTMLSLTRDIRASPQLLKLGVGAYSSVILRSLYGDGVSKNGQIPTLSFCSIMAVSYYGYYYCFISMTFSLRNSICMTISTSISTGISISLFLTSITTITRSSSSSSSSNVVM